MVRSDDYSLTAEELRLENASAACARPKRLTATHDTLHKSGVVEVLTQQNHVRMNINLRFILTIASLAFALALWFPNEVSADELKDAQVTQVIQDVRILPSNASPRPAAVNDNVRQGTAVETGTQSRSELTFKDQTITRLGEKTIFSVGEGARTIDLGSDHLQRGRRGANH